jgi:hypothetical protein
MVRRWVKYLGLDEATKLMIWNNNDPGFSLRFISITFCIHRRKDKLLAVRQIILFLIISGPIREGTLQEQTLWSV